MPKLTPDPLNSTYLGGGGGTNASFDLSSNFTLKPLGY